MLMINSNCNLCRVPGLSTLIFKAGSDSSDQQGAVRRQRASTPPTCKTRRRGAAPTSRFVDSFSTLPQTSRIYRLYQVLHLNLVNPPNIAKMQTSFYDLLHLGGGM